MAGRLLLASLARRAASHSTSAMPALCASVSTSQLQAAAQRFAAPALAHAFTSSSLAAQSLQSSLSKELKHEKADYEKPDIIAKGPPAPFTLEEQPGDTAITLKREYKGETISVDASVNLQVRRTLTSRAPQRDPSHPCDAKPVPASSFESRSATRQHGAQSMLHGPKARAAC